MNNWYQLPSNQEKKENINCYKVFIKKNTSSSEKMFSSNLLYQSSLSHAKQDV